MWGVCWPPSVRCRWEERRCGRGERRGPVSAVEVPHTSDASVAPILDDASVAPICQAAAHSTSQNQFPVLLRLQAARAIVDQKRQEGHPALRRLESKAPPRRLVDGEHVLSRAGYTRCPLSALHQGSDPRAATLWEICEFFSADGSGCVVVLKEPRQDCRDEYKTAVTELEANGLAYVTKGHGSRGDADDIAIMT